MLELVSQGGNGRSAREVSGLLDIPSATAHHILNTLVDEGLLRKDTFRRYHLGPKLGELWESFARLSPPPARFLELLGKLAAETGETAYLCAMRNGGVTVLSSVEGAQAVKVTGLKAGFYEHAHSRAAGKMLLSTLTEDELEAFLASHPLVALTPRTIVDRDKFLAELTRIRRRGYALDEGEFVEGVSCVAAPIEEGGKTSAVYSLSAPADRFRRERRRYTGAVLAAAKAAAEAGAL